MANLLGGAKTGLGVFFKTFWLMNTFDRANGDSLGWIHRSKKSAERGMTIHRDAGSRNIRIAQKNVNDATERMTLSSRRNGYH
jgi:hypothetical protein